MRFLLALIGLAAIVLIVLLSTGMLRLSGTAGTWPTVKIEGGSAPSVSANMATVTVGTENKTIEVPKVSINKPGEPAPANTATAQ